MFKWNLKRNRKLRLVIKWIWNHEIKVKKILLIKEGLDNIFGILDFWTQIM